MPQISIIVPIYKVENYLHRCVDSILAQTFTDFELILVDDGSPDNCGKICDDYAKKDNRIKVIHKENGGLSSARNAGIDIAKGDYLSFVDSDDWIHPQMIELLYQGIKENNVKCSICGYKETEQQEPFEQIFQVHYELHNGMDFLISNNVNATVAWGKLYYKSLFDTIRYPLGRLHEDEFTTYKILYSAGKISFVNAHLYYYFINENGITKGTFTPQRLDAILALKEQCSFFKHNKLPNHVVYGAKHLEYNIRQQFYQAQAQGQTEICRHLKKEMRKCLFRYSKIAQFNITSNYYAYDIAFPHFMNFLSLLKRNLEI